MRDVNETAGPTGKQGIPMAGNIPDYDINRHSYLPG